MADAPHANSSPALDLAPMPFGAMLDAVAAKSPTPGGGAVASAVGALGAALGSMVLAYSVDRKGLAEHRPALVGAAARLEAARREMLVLAGEDAAAYAELNALMKLPEDDPTRAARWGAAVERAISAPLGTARASAGVLELLATLPAITNPHLKSDLAISAVLAEAAARSAWWNIAANLSLVGDEQRRASIERVGTELLGMAMSVRVEIERACGWGGGGGGGG